MEEEEEEDHEEEVKMGSWWNTAEDAKHRI